MNKKIINIVQHSLIIAVALFTLIGLSFSLSYSDTSNDNGFLMLAFFSSIITSYYAWGIVMIGLLCWMQFLFSLAAIVVSVVSIFIKGEVAKKVLRILIVIGGIIFTFLYMLEGIIETSISIATYGKPFATLAFIPFLLNVIFTITYFILSLFAKNMPNEAEECDNEDGYEIFANAPIAGAGNEETGNQGAPSASKDTDSILLYLSYVKSYIPDEKLMSLRNTLLRSEISDLSFISAVPLKNPTTVLLFSIFLGGIGVDRFYIGDTGLGVAKLLLSSFTLGIWPIVDIFMCYKKAKEQNYDAIMKSIKHRRTSS